MLHACSCFLLRQLPRAAIIRTLILLLLACGAASSPAENQALKLDGRGDYLELPVKQLPDLTQATVEVWVKWDSLRTYSRVFECGASWRSVSIFNQGTTPDLRFNIYPRFAKQDKSAQNIIWSTNSIRTNEWMHLAAVSGPGGMLLYLNGRLVGQHTNAASFSKVAAGAVFYFGRGLSGNPRDEDFQGEMDEIRIWNHRRSVAQIREGMFKRLAGNEAGLVHLWNFDDGTANDATANVAHGKLFGEAVIVPSELGLVGKAVTAPVAAAAAPPQPPQVVEVQTAGSMAVAWWIAGALTLLALVLAWLAFMFRRSGLGSEKLVGAQPVIAQIAAKPALLDRTTAPAVPPELKEQALAELTSFAKESLVQGLFTQRAALLEAQKQAQQDLAQLEARLASLDVHDRILAYETRIADLERQVASRGEEVQGLTKATLQLLRKKLEEEKKRESASPRFN